MQNAVFRRRSITGRFVLRSTHFLTALERYGHSDFGNPSAARAMKRRLLLARMGKTGIKPHPIRLKVPTAQLERGYAVAP
jgi:hypothetical protein